MIIILALVYSLSFVFDPERKSSAFFAWLEPSMIPLADSVEITGSGGLDGGFGGGAMEAYPGAGISLIRRNNVWFVSGGPAGREGEYPARQSRVEDLLACLSQREAYTLRAVSKEGRERLGFRSGAAGNPGGIASRIMVRGGAGMPLLDLLVGSADVLGREVYLKRADKNEVYSGEDRFTVYTESRPGFWYDLRLFPAAVSVASVQQADIVIPDGAAVSPPGSYTLLRNGLGWIMPGEAETDLDTVKVEGWLRSVLEAEAEDFGGLAAAQGSITLRLGDGSNLALYIGSAGEDGRCPAAVSGSGLEYMLPQRTVNRLWRERDFFFR